MYMRRTATLLKLALVPRVLDKGSKEIAFPVKIKYRKRVSKPRMSNAHCRYVITTGRAIHETREMSKMSSVHQDAHSRARECNGMFTATEHDALIIKGHGYCTGMSATRQEPARENCGYI